MKRAHKAELELSVLSNRAGETEHFDILHVLIACFFPEL